MYREYDDQDYDHYDPEQAFDKMWMDEDFNGDFRELLTEIARLIGFMRKYGDIEVVHDYIDGTMEDIVLQFKDLDSAERFCEMIFVAGKEVYDFTDFDYTPGYSGSSYNPYEYEGPDINISINFEDSCLYENNGEDISEILNELYKGLENAIKYATDTVEIIEDAINALEGSEDEHRLDKYFIWREGKCPVCYGRLDYGKCTCCRRSFDINLEEEKGDT